MLLENIFQLGQRSEEAFDSWLQIDERLELFRSSGTGRGRCGLYEFVSRYREHLQKRADAGEVDSATVERYGSTIRHFGAFVERPSVSKIYRNVSAVNRDFETEFSTYLQGLHVSPNGSPSAAVRPMRGQAFVMDVVRALFEWAADPERGNLLPSGFRNLFSKRSRRTSDIQVDPIRELDVTVAQAIKLVEACDQFQLSLFAPVILFGLRPGELSWLFHEHVENDWREVTCLPQLDYLTKGRRDKRFPLSDRLAEIMSVNSRNQHGLIYSSPRARTVKRPPPLLGGALVDLTDEYHRRCHAAGSIGAEKKRAIRDRLMREAGQLSYDQIKLELDKLATQLRWPKTATLKDLRHLFATCLENAGVPEFYRRYLMGQSFGKAPIVTYTHVTEDKVREHYLSALRTELAPVAEAIERRFTELKR